MASGAPPWQGQIILPESEGAVWAMMVTGNTPVVLLPSGKRVQGLHPSLQTPGFLHLWIQTQPRASLGDAAQSSNPGPGSAGTALGYKWRGRAGEHHRGLGNGTPVFGGGSAPIQCLQPLPSAPNSQGSENRAEHSRGGGFLLPPQDTDYPSPCDSGPLAPLGLFQLLCPEGKLL